VFVGEQSFEAPIAPAASSLARYDLDALLWRAAKVSGVEAQDGVEVTKTNSHQASTPLGAGERFDVFLAGGACLHAPAVINAAGRSSRLIPQAGGGKWIGLKAHFYTRGEMPSTTDLYCFAGGYCGVQPVRCGSETLVNACALVHADRARTMEEVLAADPRLRERSKAWQSACDTVTTGAVSFRQPQTVRGGAFLAGDAAGFIDPFVGDGIAIALRSGAMAGEIAAKVARGEVTLSEAHRAYARRYHAAFDGAFRNARRLRRMLELPSIPRAALMALMKVPGVAGLAVKATRSA
jgi:flavin-dependent dehydrogenase